MAIKQFLHDHSEFSDNPMFVLRPMKETDKQAYMHLLSENALVDESPIGKEVREEMWLNRINKNTVTFPAFLIKLLIHVFYRNAALIASPKLETPIILISFTFFVIPAHTLGIIQV